MKTVGIICEYNPLHLGHKKQIDHIRAQYGENCTIICAMSGNFVQRGAPAILDKSLRAQAAVLSGADLVLELPVTCSLSSAEGFAAGGVKILSAICDTLCFGAESPDGSALMAVAQALLSDAFHPLLKQFLEQGISFPAARQRALEALGISGAFLSLPNNILAVEYCKAILQQKSNMEIFPIQRSGSYHAEIADSENPSATAVRNLMLNRYNWRNSVPKNLREIFQNAPLHSTAAGERAILAKLRTMTDADFEALPYGSEGLWRKLMHESRRCGSVEEILTATKSKRYTRSRLDRMVMCAFLDITEEMLSADIPYTRVLAFSEKGRRVLNEAKKSNTYVNAGEAVQHPHWELEKRCGDLYGLFGTEGPEAPGIEQNRRVFYLRASGENDTCPN